MGFALLYAENLVMFDCSDGIFRQPQATIRIKATSHILGKV